MSLSRKRSTEVVDRVNNSAWLGVKAKITPTSLVLPNNLTYEQWAPVGPRIARVKRFTTWALADWLNFGEARYGETYVQAAEATGFEPNYLRIVKYVGGAVDPSRRRESLSFSHHRLVAPLEVDLQERFLGEAEKNGWSREQLDQAVKTFKHPETDTKALTRFSGGNHRTKIETDTHDPNGFDWRSGEQTEV